MLKPNKKPLQTVGEPGWIVKCRDVFRPRQLSILAGTVTTIVVASLIFIGTGSGHTFINWVHPSKASAGQISATSDALAPQVSGTRITLKSNDVSPSLGLLAQDSSLVTNSSMIGGSNLPITISGKTAGTLEARVSGNTVNALKGNKKCEAVQQILQPDQPQASTITGLSNDSMGGTDCH